MLDFSFLACQIVGKIALSMHLVFSPHCYKHLSDVLQKTNTFYVSLYYPLDSNLCLTILDKWGHLDPLPSI